MRVLVAGATGHLGQQLVRAYAEADHRVTALVRDPNKLHDSGIMRWVSEIKRADVTQPETLTGVCNGMDIVVSALGITRQRGPLSAKDVDVDGNIQLLRAAQAANVGHFQKIAPNFRASYYFQEDGFTPRYDVPILAAALTIEGFIRKHAQIPWTIIRSNGFFSDMREVFEMARSGTVWGMGTAQGRTNPIHEADVAEYFVEVANSPRNDVVAIGGPDVFTVEQMAAEAFNALSKPGKFRRMPMWTVDLALAGMKRFSKRTYDIVSFLRMNMQYDELIAPSVGRRRLRDFFGELASEHRNT